MEGRTTSRNKARLLVLSVFLIGAAAGALSMNLYLRSGAPERPNPGRRSPGEVVSKMSDRLNLTSDQRERVGAILKETFGQYDLIKQDVDPCFQQVKPRFDTVRQASREKIRAVLSEEQLPKFEQMVREQDAERESRENRDHKKSEK
jgi:uncharacterized membrane protein